MRDRLLEQEIELRRAGGGGRITAGAAAGGGPAPEDYAFQGASADGAPTSVKLSELFEPGKNSLVIYSFMFPRDSGDASPGPAIGKTAALPLEEDPCPSCTALLDQLNGAAEHARQHINFVVVAKTSLPRLLTFAQERDWRRLRLLSSATNTYNRDYHAETAERVQRPMLNVFHRDPDAIRHFWCSELLYAPADGDQELSATIVAGGAAERAPDLLDMSSRASNLTQVGHVECPPSGLRRLCWPSGSLRFRVKAGASSSAARCSSPSERRARS